MSQISDADRANYERAKAQAIAAMERDFGKDAVIPLSIAVRYLPVLPEYQPKRRRVK